MEESEAAEALLEREGGEPLVGQARAGPDPVFPFPRGLAEAFRREADDNARDAAVADEEVRSDADDTYGDFRTQLLKEECEIVGIRRLEQHFGRTADTKPRKRRDRRVWRDPAADAAEIAQVLGQIDAGQEEPPSEASSAANIASTACSRGSRSFS